MTGTTRQSTFKLKRSNVSGKIPTTSQLLVGEMAVNTQDGFLYTSIANTGGTDTIEVRQIGWDRLSVLSGGTVNGNVSISGNLSTTSISPVNYIDFNTGTTVTNKSGRLFYDNTSESLAYNSSINPNIIIKVGQQLYTRVINNTGSLIPKGSAVTIQSASNSIPEISLAIANAPGNNNQVAGLTSEDIPNGSRGLILNQGLLSGVTVSYPIGSILYLSDTTPGGLIASTNSLEYNSRTNQIGYTVETGTTTGIIYVSINNEDVNLSLTDIQRNILEGNVISTGAFNYTGLTKTSNTQFSVSPLQGWVVYNTYEYSTNPSVIFVDYSGVTSATTPYLTTDDQTYVLVTSASTLTLQSTFPTPQQRRENIFLGKILHPTRNEIQNVSNTVDYDVSPMSALRDLWVPLKLINQGVIISANGANLSINSSAGALWGNGIGWVTNQLDPNQVVIAGQSPVTFQYRTRLGVITGGTAPYTGNTTFIDPNNYDLNGVVTAIGGGFNSSTNQRVYLFPTGLIRIQYGQQVYPSLAAAVAGSQTEQFVEYPSNRDTGILIGIISVQKSVTTLNNSANAVFNFVSKFGEVLGGTGGLSTTTLQQAYDNSSNPEIITNATQDGVQFRGGTGNDNDKNIIIENNAGVQTAWITGAGAGVFNSLSATTISGNTFFITNTPTLNNSNTQILSRNSSTGEVQYSVLTAITVSTLSATTINTTALNVDYIDFNTTATTTTQFGRINWDSGTGTLNIGIGDSTTGLVDFQVGQEEVVRVYNSEGTTLQKGEIVYVSGSQGNRPSVKRASAVSDGYSVTTLGMIDVSIPSGSEGYVTTFGIISNLNTLGLTGGTPIWLSPTTPGGYTSTKPQAPQHTVLIGYVVRVSATVGSIFVNISNGWELDEIHDVRISGATEGDLLVRGSYNGTPLWVNSKTLKGDYTISGNTSHIGNFSITGKVTTDSVQLNTLRTGSTSVGELTWNLNEGTLNIGMAGGAVTQQVGLENYIPALNTTTPLGLTNGSVIRSAGVDPTTGKIVGAYMIADGTYPYYTTLGVATEDILSGNTGYVNNFGIVRDIDTTGAPYGETWLQGDILYVSPTILGGLTNVEPEAPNLKIQVAIVQKLGVSDGSLFVRPSLGYTLGNLHNVKNTGSESDGDLLFYSGSSTWVYGKKLNGNYTVNGNLTISTGILSATTINTSNFTTSGIQYTNGPSSGYVLTSDASGNGFWNSIQPDQTFVYISTTGNDTNGTGLSNKPYQTLSKAISVFSGNTNVVYFLYPGIYTETTVNIPDNITIAGGSISAQFLNGFNHTSTSGVSNVNIFIENVNIGNFDIDCSLTSNSIISFKNCYTGINRKDSTPTVLVTSSECSILNSTFIGGTNSINESLIIGTITASTGSTIVFENSKFVFPVEAEGSSVVRMLDCSLFGAPVYINGTVVNGNTPTWEVDASTNYLGGFAGSINKVQLFNDDYYVTGATYSNGTLILNRQNGSVTVTGLTNDDIYVTGFTYNNSNTLTISRNQGKDDLNVTIDTMSGLTVNGTLSATTINSTNVISDGFKITNQTQNNTLDDFLVVDGNGDFYTRNYNSINYIPNFINVSLTGGSSNYSSVKAAVDSITGASSTNPWVVKVRPGVYYEDPFHMKSYVSVVGDNSTTTIIEAKDPNQTLIYGADQSMIQDCQIQGCTGTGVSAIVYSSSTTPQLNAIFYVENVRFGSNYTHVKNIGTGGGNSIIQCSNVKYGGFPFTIGFYCTNDGSGIGRMQLRNVTSTNGGVVTSSGLTFAKADKSGCGFIVNGALLTKAVGDAAGTGFYVENGAFLRLTGVNFQRWNIGIEAPQVGSAPSIDAIALNFENCNTDVNISHSGATGKIQGTDNFLKTKINFNAPLYEVNQDPRQITVAKKGGDFSSIKSAVDYLITSGNTSISNRYIISVGPGEFTEGEIDLTSIPYVSIVGSNIQTTLIKPLTNTQHIIKIGVNNEISFLSLSGAPSGYAGIYVYDIGDFGQSHKVSFYDCDTNVWVESNTQDTKFYGEYLDFNGNFTYGTRVIGNNGYLALANMENYYNFPTGNNIVYCNYATGSGATLSVFVGDNVSNGISGSTGFFIQDGAELNASTVTLDGFTYGIRNPNVGNPIRFDVDNASIVNGEWDLYVERNGTFGTFGGSSSHEKIFTVSPDVYWSFLDIDDGELDITRKASVTFADGTHTDFTTLVFEGATMGLIEGGHITDVGGLTINVAEGFGYLHKTATPEVHVRLDWLSANTVLTSGSSLYVFYNENGILSTSGSKPDVTTNIILGRVVTNNSSIRFIDSSPINAEHTSNRFDNLFSDAMGPIYATGSIVTQGTTPFSLNVSQGDYHYSSNEYLPTGGSGITFTQYYRDGFSDWVTTATTIVTNTFYDGNGVLSALTTNYYTKHTLYLVGDGTNEQYMLVLGQNEYSTLVETENALLPTPPSFFSDSVVQIANIYVQQGTTGITQVEDIRPTIAFRAGGVNASSVHGNLLGLSADDHTQYLLVDGGRSMSGDLNMGGNAITNVGNVDGVDVASHATRHQFGGADTIGSTTPSPNAIPYADVSGTLDSWISTATTTTFGRVRLSDTNPIVVSVANLGYRKAITGFTYGSNVLTGSSVDGTLTTTTIGLSTKAGSVAGASFAGNPKKATITFTTAYPNTNYSISITGAVARTFTYESKTTTGFVINTNANAAFTENVDWSTIAHGES